MAQLSAQIVSYDEEFKRQVSKLLRACGVPIGIVEGRSLEGAAPDLAVVDIRSDASSGMATIERLRAASGTLAIFAVATARSGERRREAAVRHARVPWREGGRGHDDGCGELRRRARAADQAVD